jgi:hypothetical protein
VETAVGYTLNPSQYAMDYYEALEGMRVSMASAVSTSPTLTGSYSGDTFVVSRGQVGDGRDVSARRRRAGPRPIQRPPHRHRQPPDQLNGRDGPDRETVGAQIDSIAGIIDYSFNNYRLLLTNTPTVASNTLTAEVAAARTAGQLGFATYNVENLGGNATAARVTELVGQMRVNLQMPQILALQENPGQQRLLEHRCGVLPMSR